MADERPERGWQDYQSAPDIGPPIDVLPGYMDSVRFLAQTDDVALAVAGFRVWDVGFLFTPSVRLSPKGLPKLHDGGPFLGHGRPFGPHEPTVLLEMRWPSGRRVSNVKPERQPRRTIGT